MTQALDYVEYLSKEIGARPAGTEEEQQAALYIADELQEQAGFAASIEEFTSSSNLEGGRAILSMVTIVVSVLAMLFNVLTAPAFILATIAAVFYALEAYDKPFLSSRLARGASQNVIAKYQPFGDESSNAKGSHQRKIVLVAHYDTGKVTPGIIQRIESMNLPVAKVCLYGMFAAAFFLLLRFFIGGTGGAGLVFINLLTIIAIIIVALPVVKAILYRMAPYNEGANNNATGVAALIEIAKYIDSGSMSEADLQQEEEVPTVHGEDEAREEGLIPEGASVSYEVERTAEPDDGASEEERLLAAKAAIAALTGQPVDRNIYATPSSKADFDQLDAEGDYAAGGYEGWEDDADLDANVVGVEENAGAEPAVEPSAPATIPESSLYVAEPAAVEETSAGFENAPSWFIAAQRNAKKKESSQPVQRSRYNEAILAAEAGLAARERAREDQARMQFEQIRREREGAAMAAWSYAQDATSPSASKEEASAGWQPQGTPEFSDGALEFTPFNPVISEDFPAQQPLKTDVLDAALPDIPAVLEQDIPSIDSQPADGSAPVASSDEHEEARAAEPGEKPVDVVSPASKDKRSDVEVNLGQTIAFTPAMIREALQDELGDDADNGADGIAASDAASEGEADGEESSAKQARKNLVDLPLVEQSLEGESVSENANPSRSGLFRMLRSDVPTIAGDEGAIGEASSRAAMLKSSELPKVSLSGMIPKVDYDMEVPMDIVDEQQKAIEEDEQEEGNAQNAQIEMPKSRAGGLINRLRSNSGSNLEDTPQEWLDVDEDFDAREVGRERGGWESFRDEDEPDARGGRNWEGGAFSRVRLGHVDMRSGSEEEAEETEEATDMVDDPELNEEIEQIYHFRNPDFNTEVWFVAIGSDTEQHDGAKAFVNEHRSELRGAMIIELESLGVGELCVASEEGQLTKIQASSRIKRFTRGAAEATGIMLGHVRLATDSITTTIQRAGFQAMHILGVEDGRPSLKGSADDILENVDELVFEENINYIVELLKQD